MMEPDEGSLYRQMGISFHWVVKKHRLDTVMEVEAALKAYLTKVRVPAVRLPFNLAAGQPVYDLFSSEFQRVSDAEAPLAVYLDPQRLDTWLPPDLLFIGSVTLDTMLVRIDFATRPHFDPNTCNRLRLEDLLQSLQQSSAQAYKKVMTLYQLRQSRTLLLPSRRSPQPPLDAPYDFLGLHPFL